MPLDGPRSGVDWGAGHYERSAQVLQPAARVLVETAGLSAGDRVLDLGAGTGNVALLAAAAGATVTAVDPSERLLSVAAAAAREAGLVLDCRAGEAEHMPVPDASADCVLSNFGLVFAADPAAAASEVARTLGQGGRALFTAWLPGGLMGQLAAATQARVRAVVGGPAPPPAFPWHDAHAVDALFSAHGLAVTEAGRHELAFTGPSCDAWLDAQLEDHPVARSGMEVLARAGQADSARAELLRLVTDADEDATGFRVTERYVVLRASR